jgi:plasmid stabilization system protein ParE
VKVSFLSPAQLELARSALYYLEASPQAAFDFEEEIERATLEIAQKPILYKIDELSGYRVKLLDKFPFSLFYRILNEDEIQIVSVVHNARRPGYWVGRI